MGIVYVLLPASMLLAALAVAAFVWAARHRQFDGVDVAATRLLFERERRDERAASPGAAVTDDTGGGVASTPQGASAATAPTPPPTER